MTFRGSGSSSSTKLEKQLAALTARVAKLEKEAPDHCGVDDSVGCVSIDFQWGKGAHKLGGDLKILCMVLSTKNELDRALAVKETWGQKCDDLLFIADYDDPSLPAVVCALDRTS